MINIFQRLAYICFLTAVFISPLIFFTDITRNPYLIQERVYQILSLFSLIFFAFSVRLKDRKISIPKTFLDLPLIAFFIIALLSVAISLIFNSQYSAAILNYSGRRMLMFFFTGIVAYYITASSEFDIEKKVRYAIIASGSISSLYALMQLLHIDFIWNRIIAPYGQRSISTFGNPNFLSSFLLVVVFWVLIEMLTRKDLLIWKVLLLLNAIGLGITMTRSTLLGLLSGLVLLIILSHKIYSDLFVKHKKAIYIVIVVIFVMIISFSAILPQFRNRITAIVNVKNMGSALSQRLLIWESSFNMFLDNPIMGVGWGSFEIFYPKYQGLQLLKPYYAPLRTHANNCHNFIFELLSQTGIVGTAVYILLIIMLIMGSFNLLKQTKNKIRVLLLLVTALAFYIDNLLNVSLFFPMPAMAFWVTLGLIAAEERKISQAKMRTLVPAKFYWLFVTIILIFAYAVMLFNYNYFASSAHFFKGFKSSRRGQLFEAEKELERSYQLYTMNVDNNYELGNVYARLYASGRPELEKSIKYYEAAIRANPGYDEIYFNLAIMYMKNQELDLAEQHLKTSLMLNPHFPDTLRSMGDLYAGKQDYKTAIEYYQKAIKINPENFTLLNNLGYYNEVQGNLEAALAAYYKALAINPAYPSALVNASRIRQLQGNKAVPGVDDNFRKAQVYINSSNWSDALKISIDILKADPINMRAMLYVGNIYFKLGNLPKAKQFYQMMLVLDRSNQTALANIAAIDNMLEKQ